MIFSRFSCIKSLPEIIDRGDKICCTELYDGNTAYISFITFVMMWTWCDIYLFKHPQHYT